MVRVFVTTLATLAIVLGVTATPARASHISMFIYSPYTGSDWIYTRGEHPPDQRRLGTARDVGWPTTPSSIVFNATSGFVGEVMNVADNCNPSETWDKYVVLALWNSARTEYYGEVHYVHITSPSVSIGQVISPGTGLGSPQTQSSNCWTGVHIHLEHSSNGAWLNDGTCGPPPNYTWCAYSSPVIRMTHSNIQRPEPLSGTRAK